MRLPMFTVDIPLSGNLLETFCCIMSYSATNTCLQAHEPSHEENGIIIVRGQTLQFAKDLIRMVALGQKACAVFYDYEYSLKDIVDLKLFADNLGLEVSSRKIHNIEQYIVHDKHEGGVVDLLKWVDTQYFWVKHIVYGFIFGYDVYEICKHLELLESIERYKGFGMAPIDKLWFAKSDI